ncbi:MAG: M20/M25/M40 family metallo-hydrolase [Pseudomonadales bacterium]|nr:M20/M25/M40 family metallo-hydrolase [Pseudomonadales bacterium]MCP5184071.1 M20/M25/M40 family metallo-hydrolase [Pseudomonadales bacterium]
MRVLRLWMVIGLLAGVMEARADGPDATAMLSAYLRVDTINPPGNESRGVAWLAAVLDKAGIAYETGESAPGRGNLWARLPGGDEPGLVLLNHIDVVPATREYWDFEPLSGDVKDGYIYGRGAIDMKGLAIAQLTAFLRLAASGRKLNRDVWFVATADEEAGGDYGAGWLLKTHGELFDKVGYVLNEGGAGRRFDDKVAVMVEVTQKVPLWLRLTAFGRPGHGSAPQPETAVTRIVRAAQRIGETNFKPRLIPEVQAMLESIAPYQSEDRAALLANAAASIRDPDFMLRLQLEDPGTHSLLRNTCSVTRLEGSSKINVVPPQASIELDCRLLPDQDPEAFIAELTALVGDENVQIETLMSFTPAISGTANPLYRALQAVSEETFAAPLIPTVAGGFTDSHFFRDRGITAYGYSPFLFDPEEMRGVHGNNERVSVENLERGADVLTNLLTRFATSD